MSKKHRKKNRPAQAKLSAAARFSEGDMVRVKTGTMDPDYANIPIGGRSGTIREIDQRTHPKMYLIEWNQETLAQIHPVYRKRSQRDDLEIECMWLDEDELELDTGDPVSVEQPTALIIRPLSKNDQDDRIRCIFGLSSDDPLPDIGDENLREYCRYLATRLSFPFEATFIPFPHQDKPVSVTVTGLLESSHCEEEGGIFCEAMEEGDPVNLCLADIEPAGNPSNRQLIEDYAYWWYIGGNRPETSTTSSVWITAKGTPYSFKKGRLFSTIIKWGVGCGIIGIPLGSLIAAMEVVQIGAIVGGVVLGLIGCWLGTRVGLIFGIANRLEYGSFYGGILGALLGGTLGALIGAVLSAIVAIFVGSVIGAMISAWVVHGKKILSIVLGAAVGATLQAFYFDQEKAMAGAIYGAIIGLAVGIMIVLTIYGLFAGRRRRYQHS